MRAIAAYIAKIDIENIHNSVTKTTYCHDLLLKILPQSFFNLFIIGVFKPRGGAVHYGC